MKSLLLLSASILLGSISAYAGFGAIAYSTSTGEYGYTDGNATYQQAINNALAECHYADCFIVNWEQNECNALASGPGGRWGGGNGFTSSQAAVNMALGECGPGCRWDAWICN